jgi:hypothetical protein
MRTLVTALLLFVSAEAQTQSPKAPACGANQLTREYEMGAGLGSNYINITVRNTGIGACLLEGPPRIEQVDQAGTIMKPEVHWPVSAGLNEGSRYMMLKPGGSTRIVLQTVNRTGYGPEKHCGAKIRIDLPRSKEPLTVESASCQDVSVSGYVSQQ